MERTRGTGEWEKCFPRTWGERGTGEMIVAPSHQYLHEPGFVLDIIYIISFT